ncbi:GNAT family N-acetyltransferase [Streptomyces polyrhachis]|uniref:GNAT family N-acetyltransferase n=1 Tax=Streptomyces polyrhachis TaxID=1282885 RepID=A0ABW2GKZ8_9ACTN
MTAGAGTLSTVVLAPEPYDGAEVAEAVWEYFAETGERIFGRPATDEELREAIAWDDCSELAPPHGVFLGARDTDNTLLGFAGVRALTEAPGTCEFKRIYVRPAARGRGLGRRLLLAAEEEAVLLGARRIILNTRTVLTEARGMYASHGYAEIPRYIDEDWAEHCFAKDLDV